MRLKTGSMVPIKTDRVIQIKHGVYVKDFSCFLKVYVQSVSNLWIA